MKCPECLGSVFGRGKYDIARVYRQQPVLIRNVPARRCKQCGYLLVSSDVASRIEDVLAGGTNTTLIPAAVFDLAMPRQVPDTVAVPVPSYDVATNAAA